MVPSLRRAAAAAAGLALALSLPGFSLSAWAQPGNGNGNGQGNGNANGQGNGNANGQGNGNAGSSASGGGNTPPGNNGHIQIDEYSMDGGNGNDPHVACGFSVSFFGYDGGPQSATIKVTPWSPTSGGNPTTFGPVTWNVGTRTSGNQFDANYQISQSMLTPVFAGVTPAAQGYHARIEVEVTGSQGSDDKYKMVWIAPCTSPAPTPPATAGTPPVSAGGTPTTPDTPSTPAPPIAAASATAGSAPSTTATVGDTPLPPIPDTPPLAALSFKTASLPATRGNHATLTSALAFTGAEIAGMVLAGLAAIGAGVLLLGVRRGWLRWT